jgi:hypothetical protein
LGYRTQQYQRVQFLSCLVVPDATTPQSQARRDYLLFILDKQSIQLYSLNTTLQSKGGQWLIKEQPRKEKTIVKRHGWWQFDRASQTLFFLALRSSANAKQQDGPRYSLRSVQFGMLCLARVEGGADGYFYRSSDRLFHAAGLWSDLELSLPIEFDQHVPDIDAPYSVSEFIDGNTSPGTAWKCIVNRMTSADLDCLTLTAYFPCDTNERKIMTVYWTCPYMDGLGGISRSSFGMNPNLAMASHGMFQFPCKSFSNVVITTHSKQTRNLAN